MRINQITDHNNTIFDDKAFVKTFALLLSLIIAISLFLIYHSVNRVNDLSSFSLAGTNKSSVSLSTVEKEINGNVISLEMLEDDFSDLAEIDLRELQKSRKPSADINNIAIQPIIKEPVAKKRKAIEITFVDSKRGKSGSKISIKRLKQKFYKTNNARYALMIAQRFYDAKRYEKAMKWSLIANEVDQKKAQSWMLFAKSKMKIGKKQDAINILNAYLKIYESKEASKLLKQLQSS